MFHALTAVVLCLTLLATQPDPEPYPKGVLSASGTVFAVLPDALQFGAAGDKGPGPGDKGIKLKVTKETRIEVTDVQVADGKPTLATKVIQLKDLHPEQPISIIVYSDGKELTLLRAVATGPKLSGKELPIFVEKLGGKVKRAPGPKDRVAYQVDLKGTKTTDADLLLLGKMKGIAGLDLSFTAVTDKGVAHLLDLADLDGLHLSGTKVTDGVVELLRKLPQLHRIELAQTAVTPKGVAALVKGKSYQVAWVGLGDKAKYRVHQSYAGGELEYNYLMIGDTYFGQYLAGKVLSSPIDKAEDRRREATTYYHRHGPVGQVMAKLEWFKPAGVLDYRSDVRLPASLVGLAAPFGQLPTRSLVGLWSEPAVAVIRLGVGTHAAYVRPYQHLHFYNSTPEITALSLPPKGQPVHFGYVQDALKRGGLVRVLDGEERGTFAKKSPKKFYSAVFVEFTRNDLRDINTNLLTKEALAEMMASATETGVVCFHTSHRYHNFTKPIIDAAKSLNLAWKVGRDGGDETPGLRTHFGSEWVVVARKAEYLKHLTDVDTDTRHLSWVVPASTGQHLWRDGQPHDLKPLAHRP